MKAIAHPGASDVETMVAMGDNVKESRKLRRRNSRKLDKVCVFLGGSCGSTTWRKELAIPTLERAGIRYYNPQVDNWSPDLVEKEAKVGCLSW